MLYHSTRSEAHFVDSAEAVLEGTASALSTKWASLRVE